MHSVSVCMLQYSVGCGLLQDYLEMPLGHKEKPTVGSGETDSLMGTVSADCGVLCAHAYIQEPFCIYDEGMLKPFEAVILLEIYLTDISI